MNEGIFAHTPNLSKQEVERALRGALIIPILSVIVLGVIYVVQLFSLLDISLESQRRDDILRQSIELERLLLDTETGMRGYLVRRELEFLEPYDASIGKIIPSIDRFSQSLSSFSEFKGAGTELKTKFTLWRQFAESQVSYMKSHGQIEQIADPKVGKKLMDSMRSTLRTIGNSMSDQSVSIRKDADERTRWVILLTLISSAVIGLYLAFYVRKKLKQISLTYDSIIGQLESATMELKKSHDDLELIVSQRTAALSSTNSELEAFCYSVSHDLRAPLRGIDGFSQALIEDYSSQIDGEGQKYLKYVREGVQKMGKLIDDLLSLSRLSRVEMRFELVNVSAICENILARLRLQDRDREVEVHVQPDLEVHGDAGLLTAAFENLLSNAWKFTSKKPKGEIRVYESRQSSILRSIVVEDNGAGFDMKYVDKLFGAFQRLHSGKDFEGTGVGLATVRRILNRHGFEIKAYGTVGEGARFIMTEVNSQLDSPIIAGP